MKTLLTMLAAALLAVAGWAQNTAPPKSSPTLGKVSPAKISRQEAEKTALARVSQGTVKEGELEREHGRLIWSFDIAKPDTKEITEVQVDANTGKVVSVKKESAASEATEQKREKATTKKKK